MLQFFLCAVLCHGHIGRHARQCQYSVGLFHEQGVAFHAWSCQGDDEVGFLPCCEHEGDGASLAVAETSHLAESFRRAQVVDTCCGVAHEVSGSGVLHISSCRCRCGAVVVAQRGDAVARQMVGDDEEGLMVEQLLVAVLLSAARHHQHHRDALFLHCLIAHGVGERACQHGTVGIVPECDFFGGVGVRWCGHLWPAHLLGALAEHQRQCHTPLRECAMELIVFQSRTIGGANHVDLHRQ